MPTIDPRIRFAIQVLVFVAIGVSQGTVSLTNLIPADWVKPAVAWCGLIAFIGTGITTSLAGAGLSSQNRIAAAASLPEVKQIITTEAVAKAAPSDKVTS